MARTILCEAAQLVLVVGDDLTRCEAAKARPVTVGRVAPRDGFPQIVRTDQTRADAQIREYPSVDVAEPAVAIADRGRRAGMAGRQGCGRGNEAGIDQYRATDGGAQMQRGPAREAAGGGRLEQAQPPARHNLSRRLAVWPRAHPALSGSKYGDGTRARTLSGLRGGLRLRRRGRARGVPAAGACRPCSGRRTLEGSRALASHRRAHGAAGRRSGVTAVYHAT